MLLDDAVAQFSAHLFSAGGRSRATVDSYGRDLEQLIELSGAAKLGDLDRLAVVRWLNKLAELELAPRSRSRKLSALRSFVGWAMEYGHLKENPVPEDVGSHRSLYLPHALTEAEVQAIIDQADGDDPAGLRDRAVLETLYATGMRVSELAGLMLADLHPGDGFAFVTGKGGHQRLVPLGQYAIDALTAYINEGRALLCPRAGMHGEVFLSRRGPISRSTIFRLVKKYAALGEIKSKVSPHTFRHSCASHMLAHGADLRLVQELLGHASLTTTQIYTHIEKSRLREVYNRAHPLA